MMKFFRKYNKQMLAVFMALLMIVFIGGSALEGLLRPDPNVEIATSRIGSITQKDQQIASAETRLLESLGQNWQRPLFTDNEPIQGVDWILLGREAEKLGVVANEQAVTTTPGFEEVMESVRLVAHSWRVKPEAVLAAMAKLDAIRQVAYSIASASTPSEAELISAARSALERVNVRAVILPAEAFVDESATFSEEQIKAHFEKYKDRELGEGLQFGYYRKPAIKVEFIKIDRDAVASKIGIPDQELEAKKFYQKNRETNPIFHRSSEELLVKNPEIGPPAPKPTVYVDWEQAREKAITQVRKERADETVAQIANWLMMEINQPWMGVPPDESGYKPAPGDVAQPDYYQRQVDRLPPALRYPETVSVHTTDFFTQEDAAKVPELGALSIRTAQSLIARTFGSVAFSSQAVIPKIPEGDKVNPADYLAMNQTFAVHLSDSRSGNAYIFRVVDVQPGGPAENLDEVRDEVIAGLRLLRGFEAAKARAESLGSCCRAGDPLKDAYEADPDLAAFRESGEGAKTGFFEPPPFPRIGQAAAWKPRPADGVFVGGGLGKLSNETVDSIFALAEHHEKLAVLEMPERAAVMTVELVETIPPQEEEFATQRTTLVTQLSDARRREVLNDWLNPEKIRARNGFELVRAR